MSATAAKIKDKAVPFKMDFKFINITYVSFRIVIVKYMLNISCKLRKILKTS